MGTARSSGTPPRAASLTAVGTRGQFAVRFAGRKQGDLTDPARSASGVALAPEPSEILGPAQSPSAAGRSDAFDFKNLQELGVEIDAEAVDITEFAPRHSASPMLFHPNEGADESAHEPEDFEIIPPGSASTTDAVTIDAGSNVTAWSIAEQSHSECSDPAPPPAADGPRRPVASAVVSPDNVGERMLGTHEADRASLLRIVAIAMGGLFIAAGLVLMIA